MSQIFAGIDVSTQSVSIASPMVLERVDHAHGVININGEDKLVAIGGHRAFRGIQNELTYFEIFNSENQKWELSSHIKMPETRFMFGCVTVAPN